MALSPNQGKGKVRNVAGLAWFPVGAAGAGIVNAATVSVTGL